MHKSIMLKFHIILSNGGLILKLDSHSNTKNEKKDLIFKLNKSKKYIYKLSNYDSLTGLPNRKKLIDSFNHSLKNGSTAGKAVFLMDIDRFHSINELYGREVGDKLLIQLADRMQNLLGKNTVFHNGADELYIILENVSYFELRQFGSEIQAATIAPFEIDGRRLYITVSIGMSHYPMTGQEVETLLLQAEIAMFKVKNNGKDGREVFLLEDAEIVKRKRQLEFGLKEALKNDEMFLIYQPKVILATGSVYSVESLIRWEHPQLGIISPEEFIPIAEESGIIIDIGYWVIDEAVRQTKAWHNLGHKISTSVNVSAVQFSDQDLVDRIVHTLEKYDLEPEYLMVEITESVTRDHNYAEEIIRNLHLHGIKVAIDDFGTGYSSLGLLNNMYIDMIKIDRSFIFDVPKNSKNVSLVKTMIQMGENLKFDILAEGIETLEQSKFLIENKCKFGQGFYFSKPITSEALTDFLQTNEIKRFQNLELED